ncbi:MAG: GDSL-type esterase/lipase family protein [Verrucomicrobiales bacterium]|jgi:lysophospholipase L1-like esterase|nr:GDSL-type esterase/lipase family protein [Verrucomicrobiales bacterium]
MRTFISSLIVALLATVSVNAEPLIKNGDSVAFLGDSITQQGWGNTGGYVHLVVDGLALAGIKVTPYPAGIGGHKSNNMLERLERDVLAKKPTWMTLSCGVNDVWHGANGVELPQYQENITAIVERATKAGVKVMLLTATPIQEVDNPHNQQLAAYNDFLRALAKEKNLPLADLSADCWAYLKPLPPGPRYLTADGVHMNPEGNLLMAKGVLRAFGFDDGELAAVEQKLLDAPNTAMFAGNYYIYPPSPAGITFNQYRALQKIAKDRKLDINRLTAALCLQAWADVLKNYHGDATVELDQLRVEAGELVGKKVANFIRSN